MLKNALSFSGIYVHLEGTVSLLSSVSFGRMGNSTSLFHTRIMYSFTKDQPSDDPSGDKLFPEEDDMDELFGKGIFNDDFFNALQESGIGTPGPDGVIKVTMDEEAVRELRTARTAIQSLGEIVPWLLEGNEEFFPFDEFLRRISKRYLKDFLQVAEEVFKKTGIPEPPGGRHPFHDRLDQLKERVEKMK